MKAFSSFHQEKAFYNKFIRFLAFIGSCYESESLATTCKTSVFHLTISVSDLHVGVFYIGSYTSWYVGENSDCGEWWKGVQRHGLEGEITSPFSFNKFLYILFLQNTRFCKKFELQKYTKQESA